MPLKTEARKPFYALAGVGDLAVENIKELPTQVVAGATNLVTTLPSKMTETYGELVERGQKLVGSIRRSSATQQAEAQIKVAKSQAKAATTSATKAVKATAKAVDKAAEKVG
jgi:HPt (histidine-containing phosphotransfer) domain-containing protein